jgi:hypothetical protein
VLKTLKSPPKDIVVLFDERLARYLERRNPEERRALSILCAWITWGLKKPSLKELNAVQVMNFGRIVLDIEREVATGLSGLFAISSLPFQAQEQETLAMFLVSGRENLTINPDGSEGGESENSGQNDDLFDESLLPELDDDNKLLLSFEDPAMHSFMRGAFGYYPSFAMNVLQTSFHMFLTFVQVITSTANGSKELVDVLQRPAVEQWMAILRSMNRIDEYFIRIGLKLSLTNAEVFDVVNAIRKVTLYPETVALNIYNHPDLSDKVYREFSWNGHTAIKYWLGRALDILAADDLNTRASMGQEINGINQDTIRWATELIKKPEEYMQPFALAQLRHALSQVDQYKATNSFRLAVTAYLTVSCFVSKFLQFCKTYIVHTDTTPPSPRVTALP